MTGRPAVALLLGSFVLAAPAAAEDALALVGGTIYVSPSEDAIRDGVVLVRGREIAAVGRRGTVTIPRDAQRIDCSGLAVAAGFWNSHVHFFERKWANAAEMPAGELARQLRDMLTRYGFTSVFDLGSIRENTMRIRDRVESGEVPGPRIRSTGDALLPPGLTPAEPILRVLGFMPNPFPGVADASQAAAAAKGLLENGVDGLLAAVKGGVDVVAHTTPQSGPWSDTVVAAMKERRTAVIPTLQIWKYLKRHDRITAQEEVVTTSAGQLRAWVAAGGTTLFGTDVGAVPYDPSEEYALLAEAGMTLPRSSRR